MFDKVFWIPDGNLYQELGLEATATSTDISRAVSRRGSELNAKQRQIETRLKEIYDAIPKLKMLEDEVKAALADPQKQQDASFSQLRAQLHQLENQAEAQFPNFKELRQQLAQLSKQIEENNKHPLAATEKRQLYDQTTSLFALLKISPTRYDFFSKNRLMLPMIRVEVAQFLQQHGEELYYPSDLRRNDFGDEFHFSPLLDDHNE